MPIDEALPDLLAALEVHASAVLVAPPGAGKTTRVPLAVLEAQSAAKWRGDGKIIVLEPRRLAARAAARRMAQALGEPIGETVGLRVRFESKTSARTRIEIVTEGVLTAMIADDPELSGISAVLFDEFHERSLDADFGLALCLESQAVLRPDLRLLVMSATLDGGRIAKLLGCGTPVIESLGRAFPVELRHRPIAVNETITDAMVSAVQDALAHEQGSLLCFLPGASEIRRVAERLNTSLAGRSDILVAPLYGALPPGEQDLAIAPAPDRVRKIVLATPIAESSLTIEGVRVVIDSGQVRQPMFEPSLGSTRLVTRRASKASVDQRMGRAGRTQAGICIRLWPAAQTASLPAFAPPEVETADLAPLLLRAALFGEHDPAGLRWLDPLPKAHLSQARADLTTLGALDANGSMTARGRALAAMPLQLREAAMVLVASEFGAEAARSAAQLAVLLGERGLGGNSVDLATRLPAFLSRRGAREKSAMRLAARISQRAMQLSGDSSPSSGSSRELDEGENMSAGALLSLGFPDRIAQRRGERDGQIRFRMANGRAVLVDATDPLARETYLVVADFQGRADAARLTNAAAMTEAEIRRHHSSNFRTQTHIEMSASDAVVQGTVREALGALVLAERGMSAAELKQRASALLLERLPTYGVSALPWADKTMALLARIRFAANMDASFAAAGDMLEGSLDFLAGAFEGCRSYKDISPVQLHNSVEAEAVERLGWGAWSQLSKLAPAQFQPASGHAVNIDYSGADPLVSVKPQQMFGVNEHPVIGPNRVPLMFSLVSPAGRPIQTTRDLPGFWAGSWQDVRRDLRGRYPKHDWPEDPANAQPTARAKQRSGKTT
ncbi:MAG: ATP-dependent helicase HrpB [Pseudomonadota bacterium]